MNINKCYLDLHIFLIFQKTFHAILEVPPKTGQILHQICKVLKWGLFRLPAYVANLMKLFTVFSGCNTCLLVGVLLSVRW